MTRSATSATATAHVVAKRVGRVNQGRRSPAVHRADALQERDRLGVLAGLRVSKWRAAPPVHGVDIRAPSDEIFDGCQVPFGGPKMQRSPIVVVCVWKSTSESGLRDPSQPSRRRVDGVRS